MRHHWLMRCGWSVAMAIVYVAASGQTTGVAEKFTAFAVNMGGIRSGPASAGTVEIVVSRWSTDAERDRLAAVLTERGPDALLDALRDTRKVGYIRTPSSLAYDLHFAWQTPGEDGGRRVILATDRPIGFREAASRPRTIDYPFTVIELRLNGEGEGEGKMSIATKITLDKALNLIELENYASQPVMLKSVRSEK